MTDTDRPGSPRRAGALSALLTAAVLLALSGCGSDDEPGASPSPSGAPSPAPSSAPSTAAAPPSGVSCEAGARTPVESGSTWAHPSQSFYTGAEPDLPTPADLEHLLRADAAAVVRYDAAQLPQASVDALRTWAESGEAVLALPAGPGATAPLSADTLDQRLDCDGLDTMQLDAFVATRDADAARPH
ncbi:hypothetical protein ABFT23_07645 [Nocardioides sp. C4-1]|uniref:hypothetical protein n=1 Tax=Nocardioides sp. C4-1 TaxID=3151851 RepID=UPI003265E840